MFVEVQGEGQSASEDGSIEWRCSDHAEHVWVLRMFCIFILMNLKFYLSSHPLSQITNNKATTGLV